MKKIYQSLDFYMLRTPVFSANMLEEMERDGDEWNYDAYLTNPIFTESILTASHHAFHFLYKEDSNLSDSERETLLKYAIRSSSRCTPYGMFSGVALGAFGEKTEVIVNTKKNQSRTRVDMGWLCSFLKSLEGQDKILSELSVIFNKQCVIKGERISNPYFNDFGSLEQGNEGQAVSLRYTKIVKEIKRVSARWITVKQIIELLKKDWPKAGEVKIFHLIKNLVENEILLTELRPTLIIGKNNALQSLIKVLENKEIENDLLITLKQIKNMIEDYDRKAFGDGSFLYRKICDEMKRLKESTDYLQIDTKVNCVKNQLSNEIRKECELAADFFARLSVGICDTDELKIYKIGFLERFGYHRMVPLMELLDEDLGMGAPASFARTCRYRAGTMQKEREALDLLKEILDRKIQIALLLGDEEIRLAEEDFAEIYHMIPVEESKASFPSIDLYVEIFSKSNKEIEKGSYQICVAGTGLSYMAGNTWGRFEDMFQQDCISKRFMEQETKCLDEDTVICSLSEMFSKGRLENISLNKNAYEYQVVMGTKGMEEKEDIAVDDIVIGVDSHTDQFYAYSRKLQKRIVTNVNNMLNPTFGSDAFRFLRSISTAGKQNIACLIQMLTNLDYVYIPRIVYGNVIIKPATWRMSQSEIKHMVYTDSFEEEFRQWSGKWKVPNDIYYKRGDNRLLLQIGKKEHMLLLKNLLKKSLKQKAEVYLSEVPHKKSGFWVKGINEDHFASEFVLSMYPVQEVRKSKKTVAAFCSEKRGRKLLPGQEQWIYLKIYVNRYRVEEFIVEEVNGFCKKLSDGGKLEKHFFIRYKDELPHIRLRLKGSSCYEMGELFQAISAWLSETEKKGITYKAQIDTYEREMERYGGSAVIDAAEDFFCEDSKYVCRMMQMAQRNEGFYSEEFIGVITIKSMMCAFDMSLTEQEAWLSGFVDRKLYRKEYLADKNMVYDALKYYETLEQRKMQGLAFDQCIREHEAALLVYLEAVRKNGDIEMIQNGDLLGSLIHMFSNRYMGNNEWERRIRAYTRHGLYSMLEEKKNFKNS